MPSFFLLFLTNNTLSIIFTHETTNVFPFLPKLYMISHVHKDFLGIQSFCYETKIILVFVQTNKFWKFKWFLRKVTILRENLKKTKTKTKTKKINCEVTPKLSFIWMNNEKSRCMLAWKQGLPIQSACVWHEERPFLIIRSQG
jgi:hypothetical protein